MTTIRLFALLVSLCVAALASAPPKKTVFVDKMNGFEEVVAEALQSAEAPLEIIEEAAHPDLKILLGKAFTSVHAEILYQKQTGRRDESILKAVDVKTGKEIVSYRFHMEADRAANLKAARTFAELLRSKLSK
ncbi:MAG: hypothetical protein IH602_01325 [Bryobacteraceae bacterium]|nr:hypothetical protein [Bryobacteraceae bacterium]